MPLQQISASFSRKRRRVETIEQLAINGFRLLRTEQRQNHRPSFEEATGCWDFPLPPGRGRPSFGLGRRHSREAELSEYGVNFRQLNKKRSVHAVLLRGLVEDL